MTAGTGHVTGVVLAGGRSSRMGRDKALLELDGKPLLYRICDVLQRQGLNVLVVTARDGHPYADAVPAGVRFAPDRYPGQGPLAGLHAALSAIPDGYAFLMACDMPYLSPELYRAMLSRTAEDPDAVVREGEPFHALYHRRIVSTVEQSIRQRELKFGALLQKLDAVTLSAGADDCLLNINTPEEYERLLRRYR